MKLLVFQVFDVFAQVTKLGRGAFEFGLQILADTAKRQGKQQVCCSRCDQDREDREGLCKVEAEIGRHKKEEDQSDDIGSAGDGTEGRELSGGTIHIHYLFFKNLLHYTTATHARQDDYF